MYLFYINLAIEFINKNLNSYSLHPAVVKELTSTLTNAIQENTAKLEKGEDLKLMLLNINKVNYYEYDAKNPPAFTVRVLEKTTKELKEEERLLEAKQRLLKAEKEKESKATTPVESKIDNGAAPGVEVSGKLTAKNGNLSMKK